MREELHDERRRRIVSVARDLFLAAGFDETGMLDIARKAGMAAGTIYNYFPSKNALLAELFRRDLSDAGLVLESELSASAAPSDGSAIAAWVRFGFARYSQFPRDRWRAFMRALYADEAGHDVDAWASQGAFRAALVSIVRARFPQERAEEAERLSRIMFAVFFQTFLRWIHIGGEIEEHVSSVSKDLEYLLSSGPHL
jgi:AcrR family transcriptional regulator